jgi:hypothetical protein
MLIASARFIIWPTVGKAPRQGGIPGTVGSRSDPSSSGNLDALAVPAVVSRKIQESWWRTRWAASAHRRRFGGNPRAKALPRTTGLRSKIGWNAAVYRHPSTRQNIASPQTVAERMQNNRDRRIASDRAHRADSAALTFANGPRLGFAESIGGLGDVAQDNAVHSCCHPHSHVR